MILSKYYLLTGKDVIVKIAASMSFRSAGVTAKVGMNSLYRIFRSSEFDAALRKRNFLKCIIDETLAVRADRIKAYSIALEVFGRDATFELENEPIVRIAAGQLRRSVEKCYLTGAVDDPLATIVPKGAHAPECSWRNPPPEGQAVQAPENPARVPIWQWWREIVLAALGSRHVNNSHRSAETGNCGERLDRRG